MKHAFIAPVAAVSAIALLAACDAAGDAAATPPATAEPAPTPTTDAVPDADLVEWIRNEYADMGDVLYRSAEIDLNGDGSPEILAYVGGPMLCGTGGCNLVVLERAQDGLRQVGDISVAQLPVGVFSTSTEGWRDLAVSIRGGGGEAGVARVPFGGDAYADNPTVAPAEPSTESYETLIEDGPLEPVG